MDQVIGIELDQRAAEVASARFAEDAGVQVIHAGFDYRPAGSWDLVTFVAVLHHLPLEQTLLSAKALVKPGGRLVVVGLSRDNPGAWSIASIFLNPFIGLLVHPRGHGRPSQSSVAPTRDAAESLAEIKYVVRKVLPGARVRTGPSSATPWYGRRPPGRRSSIGMALECALSTNVQMMPVGPTRAGVRTPGR